MTPPCNPSVFFYSHLHEDVVEVKVARVEEQVVVTRRRYREHPLHVRRPRPRRQPRPGPRPAHRPGRRAPRAAPGPGAGAGEDEGGVLGEVRCVLFEDERVHLPRTALSQLPPHLRAAFEERPWGGEVRERERERERGGRGIRKMFAGARDNL